MTNAIAKQLTISLIVLVMFALGARAIKADEVNFVGSTAGCFGLGCTPTQTASFGNVFSFQTATFQGLSVKGFMPLGGSGLDRNYLGSLGLNHIDGDYNVPFTLQINFTEPTVNGNPVTITAILAGSVSDHDGGVFIDFDNTPQTFTFEVGCRFGPGICGTGSFSMSVNDTSLHTDNLVPITGQIFAAQQTAAVPEPTSLLLLSSGVLTITAGVRRRRSKQRS